ncbi:MAG: hypothetical protein IT342_03545 [Candidatus Melainabacteria bacterium]|nr:hypothetical protein [Candidatus Melainabacteria bacterium]
MAASFRNILLAALLLSLAPVLAQGLQNMPGQIPDSSKSSYPLSPRGMTAGSVGANIWKTAGNTRVPIGTLFSGVLEDSLSSGKNKRGDIFSIRLEDGYFRNGVEVVPRHSRIVGAVINVVPSRNTGMGHPGNLQVNLQTIVFPDGSNTPISGFLVHNPNMDETQNPRKSNAAQAASYYPKAAMSSLGMVGRTLSGRLIGMKPAPRIKGSEFKLEKGEILAVRLNRSLDLTHMSPPPTGFAPSNLPPGLTSPTVPALNSGQPLLPGPAPAAGPNQIFESPVGPKPGLNMPDPF